MLIWEIVTAFIIGVLLAVFSGLLFRLKIKGATGILVNALMGGLVLVALNLFNIANFPVNPLNALIVGSLGIFGLLLIYFIIVY